MSFVELSTAGALSVGIGVSLPKPWWGRATCQYPSMNSLNNHSR